jgi:hypothetical protein
VINYPVLRFVGVAYAQNRLPPSIVPKGDDQNVYLVVDDLGRNGRVYREADVELADLETVILDLLSGEYKNPVRVVAFNIQDFVERHNALDRQLTLRLA